MSRHDEEYNYDGNVHALNNEEAYIITKETGTFFQDRDAIEEKKTAFCKEIADYILDVDHNTAIYWLACYIKENMCQDLQFIISEPQKISILAQYGTMACRFIRVRGDDNFMHAMEMINPRDEDLGKASRNVGRQTFAEYRKYFNYDAESTLSEHLKSKGATQDSKVVFRRASNLSMENSITTYQDLIEKKKAQLEELRQEILILQTFDPSHQNAD